MDFEKIFLSPMLIFFYGLILGTYLKRVLKTVKQCIYIIGSMLSPKNRFEGVWSATFTYDGQEYTESIRLYVVFDRYVLGVMNKATHPCKNALRLYGKIEENTIYGRWYHPQEHRTHNGKFDMAIDGHAKTIIGTWTGNNPNPVMKSGSWRWER